MKQHQVQQRVVLPPHVMNCIQTMTNSQARLNPTEALALVLTLIQGCAYRTHGDKVDPKAIRIPHAQRALIFDQLIHNAVNNMDAIAATNLALDFANVMPSAYDEEENR